MSNSRDAKRKKHSSKKRRSRTHCSNHEIEIDIDHQRNKNNKQKRHGLNINISAKPIKSLAKNTKKARSKPALNTFDITRNHNKPYSFTNHHDSKIHKISNSRSRYKKRISAPIILPTSTTPSLTPIAGSVTANLDNNSMTAPNTPYYSNITNRLKHKKKLKNNGKYNRNLHRKSLETIPGKQSIETDINEIESDEYLNETEINEMIRSCRRTSKSRPRAYSKSRRLSQKLFGLMESLSLDHTNNTFDDDKECEEEQEEKDSKEKEEDYKRGRESHDYHVTLSKYGYIEKRIIAKSLQGIVIEAERKEEIDNKDKESVIIKITDKQLHFNKISNKHGKSLSVQEDIIKEKKLLMYLTANNPPSSLVKFVGFFEDKYNYYLCQENGGSDFFDWIVKCHEWIRSGKLSLKQWNLYIHDLMIQIVKFIKWLHYKMNVCHLDISLENMLIKNNKYKSDGNGGIRLSRKMQIKFCDFGLAEYFNPSTNSKFLCNKYVGKTHYKAPKVYGKKLKFDARKADIWSLGVSFFMMIIGAPPYKLPTDNDDHFPLIKENNIMAILKRWGRDHYVNKHTEKLLNNMLNIDESKRSTVDDT